VDGHIDRTQLETTLVNLCVNARDAMPGGGKLLIETRNVSLNKDNVIQATDVAPGDYAMLAVTDTGMPPETRAKVFEPFFTTKEVGKGTGLGLSMVYGFIKQSNGHITIHSEVGRGTTFRLYLPRSDGVKQEVAVRQRAPLPRGIERILVVEDEPLVRASVVKQTIAKLGLYRFAGARWCSRARLFRRRLTTARSLADRCGDAQSPERQGFRHRSRALLASDQDRIHLRIRRERHAP
jgi:Histidine kinase-, DNA gyrase B-, and HSP90-like ATPase